MYRFTAAQMTQIKNLVAAGQINSNYSHIYEYISSILPKTSPEQLWFSAAAQANGGKGVYSAFIRTYSKVQMELRGVNNYSETLMQNASNQVATNAFADIFGENPSTASSRRKDASGSVAAPTIHEIANADAIGVGDTLFETIKNDSAFKDKQNAGWAGTTLFSGLHSDQTYRLFDTPENKDNAKFDKIDDLRNILFARNSFYEAFNNAIWVGVQEAAAAGSIIGPGLLKAPSLTLKILTNQTDILTDLQFFQDMGIGLATAISMDWRNALASNSFFSTFFPTSSPARSLVQALTDISDANALDMVRRSVLAACRKPQHKSARKPRICLKNRQILRFMH